MPLGLRFFWPPALPKGADDVQKYQTHVCLFKLSIVYRILYLILFYKTSIPADQLYLHIVVYVFDCFKKDAISILNFSFENIFDALQGYNA